MANEKRLIDANDLWSDIMMLPHNGDMISSDEVEQAIKEAPTVDAVEVVRCKDCIHWYEPEGVCLKIYSDGAVSPYAWQDRNADDFCSYGERKDNETG
jgi:hypothetical protein